MFFHNHTKHFGHQLKNIYYALVPIWVCSYHYEGKRHFIYVNGQTGKTDGEIIFNKKKFIKEIIVYAVTTFPLWYAMAMFLFTFGNYVKRVGILIMPLVVVGITAGQFFKGQRNQRGSLFEKVELEAIQHEAELKRAYRKLILRWHPDKNPNNR